MAINVASWVKETCTTVGTGALALSGKVDTFIKFSAALNNGDEVYYAVVDANGNRETGIGTFDGVNTLTRTTVTATLIYGAYNDVTPVAMTLSGNSVVICSFTAAAFESVLADIAAHQNTLQYFSYDSNSDSLVASKSISGLSLLDSQVIVKLASDLSGILDSTKVYYIDGVIDMGTQSIEVPSTGLNLVGGTFDVSQLISSADNYTMFTSPVGGSGNLLGQDIGITTSGINSKVYDITDATGFNAFELLRVNYNDCTSLGNIYNYRQGLEDGTGRFGGSPSLTLHGTWLGGYRITTSIVRSMSDTTTEPMFKAGTAFVMNSRFLTDINCDLGTLQPFCDFTTAMFPNPSTVQVKGALFSRDGVYDANDSNVFSNLLASDLASDWDNNIGLLNTFVGGHLHVDAEVLTTITTQNVAVLLAGTFGTQELQHFDSPANGQLRHIGINPIEYVCTHNFVLEGTANDDYVISCVKVSGGVTTIERSYKRPVNNFSGGRDVAFFMGTQSIVLNQNDYLYWTVANASSLGNCTLELDSTWQVKER